ncbi:G-type lectin S-receptor-like serine/threonine-protein kinase At4g27290 [Prunus avium]|uniref:G-type lectin S-receptor-like serine/threonine-protein kinase At4g27290 n=1 Tax=Prunus avium TaxID=42229 RepID=A0A6P5TVJ3_PRUAV|nr:G-type lectin S-receptor-like serine/threonine-protein kinase At4g27290 [Prunus avium]
MRDGETLVSAGGSFQLGFFSPGTSKGRYLGIWYSVDTETVVWVANRETPLGDSSGVLKVTEQGVLVLLNSTNRISTDDPAPGEFSVRMDRCGLPQVVTMKGAKIMARVGSWNGLYVTGYPYPHPIFGYEFVFNKDEVYYEYRLLNTSMFLRYMLNPSGIAQRFRWVYQTHSWELSSTFQADQCGNYALCGAYTSCNINVSPICACLKGFILKSPKDWNSGDWSDGCVRKIPLACSYGDGFLKYTGVKLPDTSSSWFDKSMSLKECKGLCLANCSCTAYANLDIREGGTGCLLWFGNLTDIRQFTSGGGQDLYVRMAASEPGSS